MMDTVRAQMMQAMKDKDAPRKETLSLLLSALKAKWVDKRADLTQEEENEIVLREIKQTQESMEMAPASRTDIIEACKFRIGVLQEFAPQQMSEEQIMATIQSVLDQLGITEPKPQNRGLLMKNLMPLIKGKADSGVVNHLIGELLK